MDISTTCFHTYARLAFPASFFRGFNFPAPSALILLTFAACHKIPADYKALACYSDFWNAYQKVIPPEQHHACGKEEGETNPVERFNLTLRQRLARFVRKTLSFSKILIWHLRHLRVFLVQYNHYCIRGFNPH